MPSIHISPHYSINSTYTANDDWTVATLPTEPHNDIIEPKAGEKWFHARAGEYVIILEDSGPINDNAAAEVTSVGGNLSWLACARWLYCLDEQEPAPVQAAKCVCDLWRGCTCGVFAAEMKAKYGEDWREKRGY